MCVKNIYIYARVPSYYMVDTSRDPSCCCSTRAPACSAIFSTSSASIINHNDGNGADCCHQIFLSTSDRFASASAFYLQPQRALRRTTRSLILAPAQQTFIYIYIQTPVLLDARVYKWMYRRIEKRRGRRTGRNAVSFPPRVNAANDQKKECEKMLLSRRRLLCGGMQLWWQELWCCRRIC